MIDALERHIYGEDSDTDAGYDRTRAILLFHASRWVLGEPCGVHCPIASAIAQAFLAKRAARLRALKRRRSSQPPEAPASPSEAPSTPGATP